MQLQCLALLLMPTVALDRINHRSGCFGNTPARAARECVILHTQWTFGSGRASGWIDGSPGLRSTDLERDFLEGFCRARARAQKQIGCGPSATGPSDRWNTRAKWDSGLLEPHVRPCLTWGTPPAIGIYVKIDTNLEVFLLNPRKSATVCGSAGKSLGNLYVWPVRIGLLPRQSTTRTDGCQRIKAEAKPFILQETDHGKAVV